jgi:hypothetical protein
MRVYISEKGSRREFTRRELKKEPMEKWERRLQFLNVGYDDVSNARNFDKE